MHVPKIGKRAIVLFVAFVSLCLKFSASASPFPEPKTLWTATVEGEIIGPPEFFPNPDHSLDILVTTSKGRVYRIDPKGQMRWSYDAGEAIHASAASGNIAGDAAPEIVTATMSGRVRALSAGGKLLWEYPMEGQVLDRRSPALANLSGDAHLEIIATDDAGWIVALDGAGKRLWRFTLDKFRISTPGIADTDGDERPEIIFGTENSRVACLTADGNLNWIRHLPGKFGRSAPTMADVNGDGYPDVIVNPSFNTPDARLYALDGIRGNVIWDKPTKMWGYTGIAVADFEGDGTNEIVYCDRSNTVYCFNADGTERWRNTRGGAAMYHAPAIADLDGDGRLEIVYASRYAGWGILNDRGEVVYEKTDVEANATALVGDIDSDGKIELIVPLTHDGKLEALSFGGDAAKARIAWGSQRANPERTGLFNSESQPPRVATGNLPSRSLPVRLKLPASIDWGENYLDIEFPRDMPERALAEVRVESEGNISETRVYSLTRGKLPDRLVFEAKHEGRNNLTVRLWDEDMGDPIGIAQEVFTFARQAALTRLSSRVTVSGAMMGMKFSGTPRQDEFISARVSGHSLQCLSLGRVGEAATSESDIDKVARDATRLGLKLRQDERLVARLVNDTMRGKAAFLLVWPDVNPWDDETIIDALPDSASPVSIEAILYRGEIESRAINLLNATPNSVTVQVRVPDALRTNVDLREVVEVPLKDGETVRDALPRMNTARTITLPPGEPRQIWMNFTADGLKPGVTTATLELLQLGDENRRYPIPVSLRVVDLNLADAPQFMFCNWMNPSQFRSMGFGDDQFRDAIRYGLNVITVGSPGYSADENGNLKLPVDFTALDRDLDVLTRDCFLLVSFSYSAPGAAEQTLAYGRGYAAALRNYAAHLKEKGWPLNRWAIYPVDEPGLYQTGKNTVEFKKIAGLAKKVAPEIQVYADPAGGVTTENWKDVLPLGDVWAPELGMLQRDPALVPFFKSLGATVWCYEAPGSAKRLLPLGFYRSQPWIAFELGLTGCGFWVFFEPRNDLWLSNGGGEFGANYATGGVLVESRRWQAVRDGIEDVRAFGLLRVLTEKAEAAHKLPEVTKAARELLEKRIPAATAKPKSADDITRNLFNYDPDFKEIQSIREEAARLSLELKG